MLLMCAKAQAEVIMFALQQQMFNLHPIKHCAQVVDGCRTYFPQGPLFQKGPHTTLIFHILQVDLVYI